MRVPRFDCNTLYKQSESPEMTFLRLFGKAGKRLQVVKKIKQGIKIELYQQ
jgi:hypothetical protein